MRPERAVNDRRCVFCGGSLDGRRRHAVYCSGPCRAEASRLRRLLDGSPADGFANVTDRLDRMRARKRTERSAQARAMVESIAGEALECGASIKWAGDAQTSRPVAPKIEGFDATRTLHRHLPVTAAPAAGVHHRPARVSGAPIP